MPLSKLTSFPIDRFTVVSIVLNTSIFVHCRRGRRAKQAVELLQQIGFKDAVALEETFDKVVASGICDIVGGEIQGLID
jgi:rhodanese-related sulfurtransferase